MKQVSRSTVITAPPSQVWQVLERFDRIADWAAVVDHSCCLTDSLSGPVAARRVQVGRTVLIERVFDWDPETTISYAIEGLPSRLGAITNEWKLAASGPNTEVTLTTTVTTGSRPPQRVIEVALSRRLASTSEDLLAGLQAYIENEDAQ